MRHSFKIPNKWRDTNTAYTYAALTSITAAGCFSFSAPGLCNFLEDKECRGGRQSTPFLDMDCGDLMTLDETVFPGEIYLTF